MKAAAGPPPNASGDGFPGDIIDIGDPAEVSRKLPQFEILELLGRGGMGVVYKARQLQLDRIVALKILPPMDALSPDFVARFTREARALAKLNHPNIVAVYDFGETGGLYYIVMEFVDGANLRQLQEARKLAPAEALAIVPKICDALQYAHEEGLVHRDIKPENLLIDKKGRVKIADFGLAKLLRREPLDMTLTLSGMALGTMRYMAPEQMDKPETVDHRADLYSLGVVIYEMLTGELPIGRYELPSQKAQVDARLDKVVLHALERDVERRYQHASEVKTDVETISRKPAGDDIKAPAVAKVSNRTGLLTDLIRSAAWAGIIWLVMFKFHSAWPLLMLFLSEWTEPEVDNEDARRWSKLFWIVCVVGLSGYGMWIAESFWPIVGLMFLLDRPGSGEKEEEEEEEEEEEGVPGNSSAQKAPAPANEIKPGEEKAAGAPNPSEPPLTGQPRLNRLALWGAIWAPLFFVAAIPYFTRVTVSPHAVGEPSPGPAWWQLLLMFTLLPLGALAPFGTTILGAVAIPQIKRSGGRLSGLGMAAADALFFPLIVLSVVVAAIVYQVLKAIPHLDGGAAMAISALSALAVCFLAARAAWRAIGSPPAGPERLSE